MNESLKEINAGTLTDLASAVPQKHLPETRPEGVSKEAGTGMALKIYDPAMCCSSGVCGASVDPALAQFAGTLKFLSQQKDVRIERYNLSQQPQAFVENHQVKSLLADGGEKRLPFIFINDKLVYQARYPSREELLHVLGIKTETASLSVLAAPAASPCCGGGGC